MASIFRWCPPPIRCQKPFPSIAFHPTKLVDSTLQQLPLSFEDFRNFRIISHNMIRVESLSDLRDIFYFRLYSSTACTLLFHILLLLLLSVSFDFHICLQ
jgi:hypothetical protein